MKMKKTAAAALAAIMAVGSMSVVAFADSATTEQQNKEMDVNLAQGEIFVVDNVKYTANYNGSSLNGLEVCGLADDSVPAEITIPSEIDGIEVYSIADDAFKNCSNLKSVTIPGGIIMHDSAFEGCTALATVNILDYSGDDIWNRYQISENAFKNCISLTSVKIGTGINYIECGAFEGCSALVSIDLPQSIDTIYHAAFRGCTSLSEITIPNAVKRIYASTFENCSNLSKINIGSGVIEIYLNSGTGGYVGVDEYCTGGCFEGCLNLAEINVDSENKLFSSKDGVLFLDNQLCFFPPAKGGEYVVPDWVTWICGHGTLLGGGSRNVFENCKYITSITIPASLIGEISDNFRDCTSLKEIKVNPDNERYYVENGVLYSHEYSHYDFPVAFLVAFPMTKSDKTYTTSEDVTEINSALSLNLTSITIGCQHIDYIDSTSFGSDSNITDIYFAGSEDMWKKIRTNNNEKFASVINKNITVHYNCNIDAPSSGELDTSEPATSEPTTSEPTTSDPTASDPTASESATSNPTTSNPTTSKPTESTITPGGTEKPVEQETLEVSLKNVDSENGIEGAKLDELLFGESGWTWAQVEKIEFFSDNLFSVRYKNEDGGWVKLGSEPAVRAAVSDEWNTAWTLDPSVMAKKKYAKVIAREGKVDIVATIYIKNGAQKPGANGENNPATGIALALTPAILAAGAAVVLRKKKK